MPGRALIKEADVVLAGSRKTRKVHQYLQSYKRELNITLSQTEVVLIKLALSI